MHREMKAKVDKLRGLMREKGWEGIILNRGRELYLLTCGHYAHVGLGSEFSVATIVIKAESLLLIADEIERYRLFDEEVSSEDFECIPLAWTDDRYRYIGSYIGSALYGSDMILAGTVFAQEEIRTLRESLEPEEIERARKAGVYTIRFNPRFMTLRHLPESGAAN